MDRDAGKGASKAQPGLQAATEALVLDALAKGPGETLINNAQLRTELGISAGTTQRALELLADRGALTTVSRGHLGRRIEQIEVGACWQLAGLAPLRIALSPAGALEMDALEAVINSELTRLGVPHTVQHVRGGVARTRSIVAGQHDLTVVSAGTLEGVEKTQAATWTGPSRIVGPGTYYATDRLLVVSRPNHGGGRRRIAVDRSSYDHEALTAAQFGDTDVTFVDVPFPDVPLYVLAGAVDAGVWHITDSAIPPESSGLSLTDLSRSEAREVRDALSRAAFLGARARPEIQSVLPAMSFDSVGDRQAERRSEEAARKAHLEAVLAAFETQHSA
nr:YhfZ family protein [Microbacterium barkeri]